jgi:crotonobetainyl-CoA:carnitine CoA-transferase CaiB-like acyl-CoA transferase
MTMKGRQANIEMVWTEVGRQLTLRTNTEWLALIGETDIPFAVLNELEDLLTDPHLESIGFSNRMEHETEGMLRLPSSPIEMSATPPSIRRLPPRLGENTAEVLARLRGFVVGRAGFTNFLAP